MAADIGYGSLIIAFLASLYGVGAAIYGERGKDNRWVESARKAMLLTFPLLTIAVVSIIYLILTDQFQVNYVAQVSSRNMPLYLKVSALWGSQAGSLVFWSWLLAAFASAVTLRKWDRDRDLLPWVIVVASGTLAFFLFLNVFFENPFTRLWQTAEGVTTAMIAPGNAIPFVPRDGQGLNPLLRHPGMVIHPPTLYLGFVAFIIPYAFAIASLITGRTDDRWIRVTRKWTLWAWLFLSLGLVLGARWAYDVLGWGGYWGWDPVEISAFMPWLTGTAFLHSVMIQEKRSMFKQWNMVLIILTYDLVIFGTFLTRSGVLSSVHSFAQSAIGPLFFVFIVLTLGGSIGLLMYRWETLKSKNSLSSFFSREALFLLNNLLFVGILVTSFWGVIFPLISEIVTGQKVTVGPPFYERATAPLFGGLMLLMGVAPLSAWGYSSWKTLGRSLWKPFLASLLAVVAVFALGIWEPWYAVIAFWLVGFVITVTVYEFWRGSMSRMRRLGESFFTALWKLVTRYRRRYGGYIIHVSMILMALGIIGIEIFQTETQGTLAQGENLRLGAYTMTYDRLDNFDADNGSRNVARAVVSVSKDGEEVAELYPRRDFYYDSQQPATIPGVHSTLADDFYVILVDWEPVSESGATFKAYHNPLVKWLWIGSWAFLFGIILTAWPEKKEKRGLA